MRQIRQNATENVTIFLLANKCDVSSSEESEHRTGQGGRDKYGVKFFETSARLNTNWAFHPSLKILLTTLRRILTVGGNDGGTRKALVQELRHFHWCQKGQRQLYNFGLIKLFIGGTI